MKTEQQQKELASKASRAARKTVVAADIKMGRLRLCRSDQKRCVGLRVAARKIIERLPNRRAASLSQKEQRKRPAAGETQDARMRAISHFIRWQFASGKTLGGLDSLGERHVLAVQLTVLVTKKVHRPAILDDFRPGIKSH